MTQTATDDETAVAQAQNDDRLTWSTPTGYDGASLTISSGDGYHVQQEFAADEQPTFVLLDNNGASLPDGQYTYELRFKPLKTGAGSETEYLTSGREEPATEHTSAETAASSPPILSGTFTLQEGSLVTEQEVSTSTHIHTEYSDESLVPQVFVHPEDVTIQGNLCTGFDCTNTENYGFDIHRFKESNIRIHFDDTSSSGSFANNDWRILINDINSGGSSYFAVENSTSGAVPFTISDSAIANSLYIMEAGGDGNRPRIGVGTATPGANMHLNEADTPTLRLSQDGSNYPAYSWDIAGHEQSFFIRDINAGSKLPFRVQTGSPSSSIIIRNNSRVGIAPGTTTNGFTSLDATLHVKAADATFRVQDTVSGTVTLDLDSGGNLTLNGLLTEASDRALKENIAPVNNQTVLDALAGVPINTWNYISDQDEVRHMGPMAQDFYAAFGLGADDRHIAPLDANGVALAGVQELYGRLQSQESQITALEEENADLEQRLVELEAAVAALLAQQEQ